MLVLGIESTNSHILPLLIGQFFLPSGRYASLLFRLTLPLDVYIFFHVLHVPLSGLTFRIQRRIGFLCQCYHVLLLLKRITRFLEFGTALSW